jgi:tetratricopeptide (TPR) repeat protein
VRTIAALTLYVCLPCASFGAQWEEVNREGSEAFGNRDFDRALALFERGEDLAATPVQKATTANNRAAALVGLGRHQDAIPWFDHAFELWSGIPGRSEDMADTAFGLVDALRIVGGFPRAEQILRQVLARPIAGERRSTMLTTLGDLLREQGRLEEARPHFEAVLAIPGISRRRRIEALLGLGDLDRRVRNWPASRHEWSEAAELARADGAPAIEALALRGLGMTFSDSGDFARAEPPLRRSLDFFQRDAATFPRQAASALSCMGQLYRRENKFSLAEQTWLQALDISRRPSGGSHPQTAGIMESLAELYSAEKRFGDAEPLARQALDTMTRTFGAESVPAATALALVARVEQSEKRLEAAADDFAAALRILSANHALNDTTTVDSMVCYAAVLKALHRVREARQVQAQIKTLMLTTG